MVGQKWCFLTGMGFVFWNWILFCHFRWSQFRFTLLLFPVSTVQIIGKFWKNRCSSTSDVAPIALALIADTAILVALHGIRRL
jgi:hypothetical protein